MVCCWGLLWRSENRADGKSEHLICNCLPVLFSTRREALAYIKEHYGYIATRPDLRREPHGWKMPLPVRVTIAVKKGRKGG